VQQRSVQDDANTTLGRILAKNFETLVTFE
jgi:hypothetical protein